MYDDNVNSVNRSGGKSDELEDWVSFISGSSSTAQNTGFRWRKSCVGRRITAASIGLLSPIR